MCLINYQINYCNLFVIKWVRQLSSRLDWMIIRPNQEATKWKWKERIRNICWFNQEDLRKTSKMYRTKERSKQLKYVLHWISIQLKSMRSSTLSSFGLQFWFSSPNDINLILSQSITLSAYWRLFFFKCNIKFFQTIDFPLQTLIACPFFVFVNSYDYLLHYKLIIQMYVEGVVLFVISEFLK